VISDDFGVKNYLIIDTDNGEIIQEKYFQNPYFEENSPHGARFAKAIRADKIFVSQIGDNAKNNLENFGIKVEIVPGKEKISALLDKIRKDVRKESK